MENKQDNLKRLKGADRIRKQVNVMLGSDDIQGVQQGLFEIVSNSIDRYRRGFGDKIEVIKNKDLSYEVIDYADGLPMTWNESESAYNWELATRVLYSGGNYDKDSESIGQHGLGLASTLMSSSHARVISNRNKECYQIQMIDGRPIHKITNDFICDDVDELFSKEDGGKILLRLEDVCDFGTWVTWTPDKTIFTNTDIPIEWINDKLKKQAIVNKGLTIKVIDRSKDKEYVHIYENGINDYIKELSKDKEMIDFINIDDNGRGQDTPEKPMYDYRYEFVMTLNNENTCVECYHNSSELLHGGSTLDAIKKSLVDVIHDFCNKNNLYQKNEKKIRYTDVEDSLLCVISSFSNRTSFTNQTKLAINNEFIKQFTTKSIYDKLTVYFTENINDAKRVCEQILINKRASEKAESTKLDLKNKLGKKSSKGLSMKIEGLQDCNMRESRVEERILLLTEGLSASSTVIDSFDGRYMGCYGLKGRFINSLKGSVKDVLNNEPALGIINAMGCGIEIPKEEKNKFKDMKTFNDKDSRYNIVGILCDADAFGKGIALSLITFFRKFMPTLLKNNRICVVISPRYELHLKNDIVEYAYDEKEKEHLLKKYGNQVNHIGIVKGLGEMNADEFWTYVLSPEAREKTFINIDYNENMEEFINDSFNKLMGDNIEERKQFIRDNIVNINLDEVE